MATPRKPGAKRGRPSGYLPPYARQAFKLCLLGATDAQLADFFGCNQTTLYRWQARVPEFRKSITRGKLAADAEVAHSLYQRALGYSHKAEKIVYQRAEVLGEGETAEIQPGHFERTTFVEHYPPDTPAASLWLRNRQPDKWRNIVDVNHHNARRSLEDWPTADLLALLEAESGDQDPGAPAGGPAGPGTVH